MRDAPDTMTFAYTIVLVILVGCALLFNECSASSDLPSVVSFSTPALLRILRGDITLKGHSMYVAFADYESDTQHLQCFQELAEMIEKDVIFDDLLFMHAKEMSTSGAMQEVLLVEEDNANDIVRVVDPAAANIWSVGNLCDTAAFRSELGKIISGDADILPRSERTTPTFGDSLKSQEGESGGENEIFATEFRETILNRQSFDSVVYIYDPSCAVCKSMAPVWKQVVKNHKHVQTLELFAMNGRENDVKGVVVNSYPTLLLFSAFGKSEYREYKGSRTAGHISAWIHENTGNRFTKAPDSEAQKTEL